MNRQDKSDERFHIFEDAQDAQKQLGQLQKSILKTISNLDESSTAEKLRLKTILEENGVSELNIDDVESVNDFVRVLAKIQFANPSLSAYAADASRDIAQIIAADPLASSQLFDFWKKLNA